MYYRNYKNFDEYLFLGNLERITFSTRANGANKNYQFLTETFLAIVEKHTPLKKIARHNQTLLVNRESRKATCTKCRL